MELEINQAEIEKSLIDNANFMADRILGCMKKHNINKDSSKDDVLDFFTDLSRDSYIAGYINGMKSVMHYEED